MKFLTWIKTAIKKCPCLYRFLVAVRELFFTILQRVFFIYAKDISEEIEKKSCLVIAPHPDDETLGCGATILRARKAGQPVRIVIVTDGRASSQSAIISPEELAARRREEMLRAGAILGVDAKDIVFLSFKDGGAGENMDKITASLLQQIKDFSPQRIFSPLGMDLHRDHQTVADVVNELVKTGKIACPVHQYPIWFWSFSVWWKEFRTSPKTVFQLLLRLKKVSTKGWLEQKKAALAEHRSQCENLTDEASWQTLHPNFLARFFVPYEVFTDISIKTF